ncbi:MAG: sigma 54-interacting transcriptional regulator [Deltaproteobacteria bacterium]|nr:sigma 54-interacting transcriptional regulator [Deltaproteobacteria bacterium]
MINWDEFDHIHVIKKLKEIIARWWNIDVYFADDRGNLKIIEKGVKKDYSNFVCNLLLQREDGYDSLGEFAKLVVTDLRKTQEKNLTKDWLPNFAASSFPIIIDNDFMGAVICAGYFRDGVTEGQKKELSKALAHFNLPHQEIDFAVNKVRSLTKDELAYFAELSDLVSQEISTLHKEIGLREERINELNKELGIRYKYDSMIGKSKPMQELYALLDKIKNSESTCLIQGENGTGKELIAKAIHYNSPRNDKIFVTQNCSAFNDNLLDSELFGHVKGSFTGAVKDKKGLFEVADGGTFFLDEIGDTSPSMQVKLLRVIQEGTFIPVGATEPRKVDVRIIAATNKDLKDMVEKGTFREDLYYRINVINITVPPLRERKEDIPLLCEHFLARCAQEKNIKPRILTKRALEKIFDYPWPGNIRELENEMERVTVLAGGESKITVDMLSARIREYGERSKVQGVRIQGKLRDALEELEREMIREGLKRTGWNKSRLAKELGISRAGLINKVEKYNLDKRKLAKKPNELG